VPSSLGVFAVAYKQFLFYRFSTLHFDILKPVKLYLQFADTKFVLYKITLMFVKLPSSLGLFAVAYIQFVLYRINTLLYDIVPSSLGIFEVAYTQLVSYRISTILLHRAVQFSSICRTFTQFVLYRISTILLYRAVQFSSICSTYTQFVLYIARTLLFDILPSSLALFAVRVHNLSYTELVPYCLISCRPNSERLQRQYNCHVSINWTYSRFVNCPHIVYGSC